MHYIKLNSFCAKFPHTALEISTKSKVKGLITIYPDFSETTENSESTYTQHSALPHAAQRATSRRGIRGGRR